MRIKLFLVAIFLATVGTANAAVRSNVALNQQIEAGSSAGISFDAGKANDGDKSTLWQGTRSPDYLKVSLKLNKLVDQYIIRLPVVKGGPANIFEQLSTEWSIDGVNWKKGINGISSFAYCDGSRPGSAGPTWDGACSIQYPLSLSGVEEIKYFRINTVRTQINGVWSPGGQVGEVELMGY